MPASVWHGKVDAFLMGAGVARRPRAPFRMAAVRHKLGT
ncbi:hypothetical protein roselon_01407 [Roseibacterium elongatum DSM 19469]|uniref:Uncharacterized protein n=1 Tax=Roseicyclus elongatus DSM 19469 TaxID=1294273 RepID=W8S0V5_9RHOB|nr:hypothetical protein roselon_01407 [Roseibacterium elongatum DSM 19469]